MQNNTSSALPGQYQNAANLNARIALHQKYSTNKFGWFRWLFGQLKDIPPSAAVLDIGCGQGNFWRENISEVPAGWVITLSDLSDGMMMDAWRNLVVTNRSFKYKQADATHLPFSDASFDVVIANHMLYAVSDTTLAIREIRRVLKPGGTLLASTFGKGHLLELYPFIEMLDEHALQDQNNIFYLQPSFRLDNGAAQLEPVFSEVARLEYEDSFVIDATQPIMDYLLSGFDKNALAPGKTRDVQRELKNLLAHNGNITITKRSGCFVCK